ncbi:MAG: phage head closure protein [Chloroflexi bacterium]|nr:phage head closure protein [Chloroflexota bacterium]
MNLNGKISNPGELRVPITLQGPTMTADAGGAQRPTWATLTNGAVLAKWVNVHGMEAWAVNQAGIAVSAATVTIRYRADVTSRCSILKGSERWEIVSPDDIQERHEYLELKVKHATGSV